MANDSRCLCFCLLLLLLLLIVAVVGCCCCWLLLLLLTDWLHCCQKCWAALSGESKAEKEFDANDENAMTNGLDADVDVDADVAGLAYYGEKWNEMKRKLWAAHVLLAASTRMIWQQIWKPKCRNLSRASALKRDSCTHNHTKTHTHTGTHRDTLTLSQTNMKRKTLAMNFYNHQTTQRQIKSIESNAVDVTIQMEIVINRMRVRRWRKGGEGKE